MSWVELCPLKEMLRSYTRTVNVTLFGSRVFANDQVKMRSFGWILIQYDCVLTKRRSLDTKTPSQTACEDEGS